MSTAAQVPATKSNSLFLRRSPREVLDMFLERWWLGLILGLPAALGIFFFHPKPEPVYRTEVTLQFEARRARVLNMTEVYDNSVRDIAELNTHMEQLRSKTFAEYLMSSFTKDELKRIEDAYADPMNPKTTINAAEIIIGNTYIAARRNVPIVAIGVTNKNPELTALIANRYARKYIDYTLDRANSGTNSAIIFLRNQVEELRAQVEAAEGSLAAFRAKYNLAALGENQSIVTTKLGTLGGAVISAEMELLQLQSALDKISEYQAAGRDLSDVPMVMANPQVAGAKARKVELKGLRIQLEGRYLRKHPKMVQLALEESEAERKLSEGITQAILDIRSKQSNSTKLLQNLKVEMQDTETKARELQKLSVESSFLDQDVRTKTGSYGRVVDRLNEAKITSQLDNTNIKIFDSAYVPSSPYNTGTLNILGKAVGAGLLLLLGVPLGFGFLDTRVRSPSHIEDNLGQNLLGAIRPLKKMSELERATVFSSNRDEAVTETYRGIFSEMELRSGLDYPKSLIVTSSVPAEGKSQIICNLGAVFASHEKKTLLIDCDLRHPRLHKYFGLKVTEGWVHWISKPTSQRTPVPGCIHEISPNLHLLPAGELPPNPTELIDRLSEKETLRPLAAIYDVILIDTPPLSLFPDALLLARTCHELVFVCKYKTVSTAVIRKSLLRLQESGIATLGMILNQIPQGKISGYGYYQYYGYGAHSTKYYKAYREKAADESKT